MTRFKGTPLFGQDSSPQNTSFILGLIGTGIFWFLLLICALLIKPVQKKPKYKEVQIVLSSTPKKEKTAENPAPATSSSAASDSAPVEKVLEKPVEKPVESPVQEKVQESVKKVETQPKKVTETKKTTPTTTKKTAEAPAKKPAESVKQPVKEEPVIYKSVEERMAEQFAAKPKAKNDDYDPWAEMEDEEDISPSAVSSSAQSEKIVKNVPAFEGSAATTTKADTSSTSSSTSTVKNETKTASAGTSSALSNIKDIPYEGIAENGVKSSSIVKASTLGSGEVQFEMSNGSKRSLYSPKEPKLELSPAAAMTIETSKTVKIKFKVLESGNVLMTEIKFDNPLILSTKVKEEIIDQISQWLFEPANDSAYAEFEYKIVKW